MEGFGIIKETPETDVKTSFDNASATKLYDTLQSRHLMPRGRAPSMSNWADQFRLLRKYVTEQEITQALEWFLVHLEDSFCPKLYSAKKFRIEFDRLVQAMSREGVSTTPVRITPWAIRAQKELGLSWDGISKEAQYCFLQISLNNYLAFETKVQSIAVALDIAAEKKAREDLQKEGVTHSKDFQDTRLFRYLYGNLPNSQEYVLWWAKEIHGMSLRWAGWDGNLLAWVIKEDSKRFLQMIARIVGDYSNDESRYFRVLELLKGKTNERQQNTIPGN